MSNLDRADAIIEEFVRCDYGMAILEAGWREIVIYSIKNGVATVDIYNKPKKLNEIELMEEIAKFLKFDPEIIFEL